MQEKNNRTISRIKDTLAETRSLLDQQRILETRNLRASVFLRIVQYVICGFLIIFPFFEVPSSGIIVLLGFILLVSIVIQHYVHPDVRFITARSRVLKLKRIVQSTAESLSDVESREAGAAEERAILEDILSVLGEVERAQHLDYAMLRIKFLSRHRKPSSIDS
jgi:hypothetical protein